MTAGTDQLTDDIAALHAAIREGRVAPDEAVRRFRLLRQRAAAFSTPPGPAPATPHAFSGADPLLQDHTVGGVPVLVGVMHASLVVRAFFEWFPGERSVEVRPLTFLQPIELQRDQRAEVRVQRATGERDTEVYVQYRVQPDVGWEPTASGRVQPSTRVFGKMPPASFHGALQPVADLEAIYAAGEPHFQVGPSFRVICQLYVGETEALARLDLTAATGGGSRTEELSPLIAYSAFSAALPLLAGAGFREAFLPFGIKSLHFRRGHDLTHCWVLVRLVKNAGELALFDADVVTPEFDHVAEFRGCSVKRLRGEATGGSDRSFAPASVAAKPAETAAPGGPADAVQQFLLRKLGLSGGPVNLDANLMELGLASAQLVGLAAEIQSDLGIELEPTLFFEYPNVRELAAFFALQHGTKFGARTLARPDGVPGTRQPTAAKPAVENAPPAPAAPGRPLVAAPPVWPLSEGQRGLWVLQRAAPDMTAYHCPLCFRVRQAVDPVLFETAGRFVVRQHPVLGARIEEREGAPVFVAQAAAQFALEQVDASGWDEAQIRAWIDEAVRRPFFLGRGPLLRGALLSVGPQEAVAVFVIHHVAFDGASFGLFVETLRAAYRAMRLGEVPPVAAPSGSHADYASAERRWLSGAEGAKRLAYWREQLSGALPQLDVYPDYPRARATLHAGRVVSAFVAPEAGRRLKTFANQNAVYPSAVFLSAFQQLLHLSSRQDDLIVGMPATERADPRYRSLIGYLVNLIPLRSRGVGSGTFRDLVKATQRTMANGLAQRYPFPALVRELKLSASGHPVFQAAFEYQNFFDASAAAPAGEADPRALPIEWIDGLHQRGEYELALEVYEQGDGFQLNLKFNPTLWHEDTARRWLERIEAILRRGIAAPEERIGAASLVTEDERTTLLHTWNDTAAEYPKSQCIHEWFERQAAGTPEAIAVESCAESLSYRELEVRSRRLALALQRRGLQPDAIVGLCVERSCEMLIGLLGVLRAGGAYLPLDPEHPEERLTFMVTDSRTRWVLTQSHLVPLVRRVAGEAEVVALDGDAYRAETIAAAVDEELRREVRPRNLACVIYTSGSTGQPKGVMVEHESMCNRIVWMQRAYGLTAHDVVLQKTPYSFDVSGWEFHWPLLVGARLVMAEPGKHRDPEYIRDIIARRGVTVLHFVPSMLQAFLAVDEPGRARGARLVFCSGEELTVTQKDLFFERFPAAALHNLYGPTEAAIDVTAWECRPEAAIVPIGKPIANVRLYIVDEQRALVPIGVAGELCLAGDCLARGYLNRPELTAEKFVANPFEPGARMYRTGDLARWLPDGSVQYLGRIDHQVKIRGFRIELGEIEDALARVAGVEQAVVVAVGTGGEGKRLIAYFTGSDAVDDAGLKSALRQRLPDYMVPGAFVRLVHVPLTSSGKVDRRALAGRPVPIATPERGVGPRNEVEARLLRLWKSELKLEAIGMHDSFFDLGGHSLLALSVMARINAEFETGLPLATLFEARSIAELASRLAAPAVGAPERGMVAVQTRGTLEPLHLVPGLGGSGLSFLPLSKVLGDEQPLWVFQFPGLEDGETPLTSVPALAEYFVERLLRRPRQTHYTIGGWSLGGVIAFEMTRRLEQRGITARLVLLDSYLAEHLEQFGAGAELTLLAQERTGDPGLERRAAAVVAAGERAWRSYRPAGVFNGDAVYFFAARNVRGPDAAAGAAAAVTRNVWLRYVPRLEGHFFSLDAAHDTLVQEVGATEIAPRLAAFLRGELPSEKGRERAAAALAAGGAVVV